MKKRAVYIALRQAVITNGYTIQQVESATLSQAATLAGVSEESIVPFMNGIKQKIIAELQGNIDDAKIEGVKAKFMTWLNTNYPDNVVEKDVINGKLFIGIWPEGKD